MSQISQSEQALDALESLIKTDLSPIQVSRNDVKNYDIPDIGRISIDDGVPKIQASLLGGQGHDIEHEVSIIIAYQHENNDQRKSAVDALNVQISNILAGDLTLSGAVTFLEQAPMRTQEEDVEGAAPIRYGEKTVTLYYSVQNNTI